MIHIIKAVARSLQLVRPWLALSTMLLNAWADVNFSIFIWLFCLLLCNVLSLSSLQITLALCLLLNFCTVEYLVLHEMFLHAWAADYFPPHHILFLSAVLYYNKLYKSKNHPITFIYHLLSVKWNFVLP